MKRIQDTFLVALPVDCASTVLPPGAEHGYLICDHSGCLQVEYIWTIVSLHAWSNQTCMSVLVMRNVIVHNLWAVTLFAAFVVGYPPHCDETLYGQPNANACRRILNAWTGHRPERQASHTFGIAGMERPDGVSTAQWANKNDIPKFWPRPPGRALHSAVSRLLWLDQY